MQSLQVQAPGLGWSLQGGFRRKATLGGFESAIGVRAAFGGTVLCAD